MNFMHQRRKAFPQPMQRVRRFNNFGTSSANAKRQTTSQKLLGIVKEWGSVATLAIAIIYTFPFTVFDRFVSSGERPIAQARQVLADASSMVIEKINNTSRMTDQTALESMNRMYGVKFYNLVYSNKDLLKNHAHSLRSSEISTFAGLLAFSGLHAETASYYDLAIQKAIEEKTSYVNILRDQAQVYLAQSPIRSVEKARSSYLTALENLSQATDLRTRYSFNIFLTELAYAEATAGDWLCATDLYGTADRALDEIVEQDPSISTYVSMVRSGFSALKKGTLQSAEGCSYAIPSFDSRGTRKAFDHQGRSTRD